MPEPGSSDDPRNRGAIVTCTRQPCPQTLATPGGIFVHMETRVRYAEIRPYVVPDLLSELIGPTDGFVELPIHLDWSQQRRYSLAIDKDRRRLYETVIREAMDPTDLAHILHKRLLLELWPSLWLPPRAKSLWQEKFPELRHIAAA